VRQDFFRRILSSVGIGTAIAFGSLGVSFALYFDMLSGSRNSLISVSTWTWIASVSTLIWSRCRRRPIPTYDGVVMAAVASVVVAIVYSAYRDAQWGMLGA
jgi:hypothetical protein